MTDRLQFTAATDKDIFDLLMSSRQRMTEANLRWIALQRGIIYSPETTRDKIASEISLLPHDYASISSLIRMRESAKRQEKMTYVTLPVELNREEISDIVEQYKREASSDEEVVFQSRRSKDVNVKIAYDEIDYSKTRLIQRQRKDAEIEFIVSSGSTIIRMPATEKAKNVVDQFRTFAERVRTEKIPLIEISLKDLSSDKKSMFFLKLMQAMNGFAFKTVVNMRVSTNRPTNIDFEIDVDLEVDVEASEEIVGIVSSVVLSGVNLEKSDEYQSLNRKGYYFTSVAWQANQKAEPRDLMLFGASFENGVEGTGFRYTVKTAKRSKRTGEISSSFEHLDANRQPFMWSLIETTASEVLRSLKDASLTPTLEKEK